MIDPERDLNPPDDSEPEWVTDEIEITWYEFVDKLSNEEIGLAIVECADIKEIGKAFKDYWDIDDGEAINSLYGILRKRFYETHRQKVYDRLREEGRI